MSLQPRRKTIHIVSVSGGKDSASRWKRYGDKGAVAGRLGYVAASAMLQICG